MLQNSFTANLVLFIPYSIPPKNIHELFKCLSVIKLSLFFSLTNHLLVLLTLFDPLLNLKLITKQVTQPLTDFKFILSLLGKTENRIFRALKTVKTKIRCLQGCFIGLTLQILLQRHVWSWALSGVPQLSQISERAVGTATSPAGHGSQVFIFRWIFSILNSIK